MIRPGREIGRIWRAGVVDLYHGLLTFLLILFSLTTCGLKTSRAVRELQQEGGWNGIMAERKNGSGTVRFDQHAGATYIS